MVIHKKQTVCQKLLISYLRSIDTNCRIQKPDIKWAGWVGAPGGAPGRSRAKIGANRIIRSENESPPLPPRHRTKYFFTVPTGAQTGDILCKPTEEQNQRLTIGFISGVQPAGDVRFFPCCQTVERRPIVIVNPFHARHVREHSVCGFPFGRFSKGLLVFFSRSQSRLFPGPPVMLAPDEKFFDLSFPRYVRVLDRTSKSNPKLIEGLSQQIQS